jgi:AraC-like DNA-binding protein
MVSDARAQQAREHHRAQLAQEESARRHRDQRDRLVKQLRREDPVRWTYPALAGAVGCSPELIAAIIKDRTRTARR